MKRIRERVHELTEQAAQRERREADHRELNPVLRGWGNYFRTGNADRKFNKMDDYV